MFYTFLLHLLHNEKFQLSLGNLSFLPVQKQNKILNTQNNREASYPRSLLIEALSHPNQSIYWPPGKDVPFQAESLHRDMFFCLRPKYSSALNDPSLVLSGKGILPNRLQATFPKSYWPHTYKGFLIRNRAKFNHIFHKIRKQVIEVSFFPGLKISQP